MRNSISVNSSERFESENTGYVYKDAISRSEYKGWIRRIGITYPAPTADINMLRKAKVDVDLRLQKSFADK